MLRLATRGSALARWQTAHVADRLRATHADLEVEPLVLQTTGDRETDAPLWMLGERGLFTREVDRAVLAGDAHAAVHSLKDLPTRLEDGLVLAAVLEREDPRDAWLSAAGASLGELPDGAVVGTSSLRRRSQLLALRPDLAVEHLRGNVDTRVARVREGKVDAAILAAAGLRRLGLQDAIVELLDPPGWLPAPGQGALALVARDGDDQTLALLGALDHAATLACITAERAFLATLEGGCQVPIGALATAAGNDLRLLGYVGSLDGRASLRGESAAPAASSAQLGATLAAELIARGADAILAEIRRTSANRPPLPAP